MSTRIDPIELELFKNAIFAVADEMAVIVRKTAYSSVVRDNMDFSTALTDGEGRVVAQGLTIAGHLGSIPSAIQAVLATYSNDIGPGDIFALNDPYCGGMHLPDVFVFKPVFHGAKRVAFTAVVCHHSDVGGRVAGSNAADSTEIFQEGLRIGPVRLHQSGQVNETLVSIIERNVRLPEQFFGDIDAQIAACRIAERRVHALIEEHGSELFDRFVSEVIDYAEILTRDAIKALPDGEYDFEDWIDDEGVTINQSIRLYVKITKFDDSIVVDWTGSADQVKGAINSTLSYTTAVSYCAIRSILEGAIPDNEGMFRPIKVIAPAGTITNVVLPGACAARGLTGFRMLDCAFGALSKMSPEKVYAASDGGVTGISMGGYRRDRSPFVYVEFITASWGGRPRADGPDGISNPLSNLSLPSAEAVEAEHPIEILACEFVPDTAGPGRFRGGSAMRRQYRFCEQEGTLQVRADRHIRRPYGLYGGYPGSLSHNSMQSADGMRDLSGKATVTITRGEVFTHVTAGAGGWGDPLTRDPGAVLRDLRNGIISETTAREVYGVVVETGSFSIDDAATSALRDNLRKSRGWTSEPVVMRDRNTGPDADPARS